ncbi:AraC family transcriptional regulator [Mesorhizobium sp. L-8-10]|uniref:AraC family transcriptional regulator n=1 Tax=Mesorhizobium sp. L-8-10 TaxID=2744523 RepID=UPI001925DDD3|nr:AraC family transcriptional regulator [Mesorhizobium sp. L-8-10]
MGTFHDPASRSLDPASFHAGPPEPIAGSSSVEPGKDVLSDVLRAIKLTGALFFRVDASSPWSVEVPEAGLFAHTILPRSRHVVSYHIITRGSGWISVGGGSPTEFAEGDILVIPQGDRYAMRGTRNERSGMTSEDSLDFFRAMAAGRLPFVVSEGGGGATLTKYVCGFLGCDAGPFNPLLGALPRLMRIARVTHPADDLLDRLIDMTLAEPPQPRAGAECIRLRLGELMFVEVIRRYLETLPPDQSGWLAALRDPAVGRAIAMLHDDPARDWSLEELAREAGVSRSVLAARFASLVGWAPMRYLVRWRMQLAARLLADGNTKVSAVGRDIGYESEAVFSRSFKRIAGVSPREWRDACRN